MVKCSRMRYSNEKKSEERRGNDSTVRGRRNNFSLGIREGKGQHSVRKREYFFFKEKRKL